MSNQDAAHLPERLPEELWNWARGIKPEGQEPKKGKKKSPSQWPVELVCCIKECRRLGKATSDPATNWRHVFLWEEIGHFVVTAGKQHEVGKYHLVNGTLNTSLGHTFMCHACFQRDGVTPWADHHKHTRHNSTQDRELAQVADSSSYVSRAGTQDALCSTQAALLAETQQHEQLKQELEVLKQDLEAARAQQKESQEELRQTWALTEDCEAVKAALLEVGDLAYFCFAACFLNLVATFM